MAHLERVALAETQMAKLKKHNDSLLLTVTQVQRLITDGHPSQQIKMCSKFEQALGNVQTKFDVVLDIKGM